MELNASRDDKITEKTSLSQDVSLLLLENNPIVTAMIDHQGNIIYLNPLFVEVTGYQLEDIPTITVFNEKAYPDAAYRELLIQDWKASLRRDRRAERHVELFCNDGIWRNFEVHSLILPNHNIIVYARDYTAQKKAETLLLESEARYKALSEASFEGIVITEDEICLDANQSALRMVGYNLEDVIGNSVMDLIAPESQPVVKNYLEIGYELPYEALLIKADGSKIPVEIQGKMFNYLHRRVRASTIRDLTEHYRNQEEIARKNLTLQALFYNTPSAVVLCDIKSNIVMDVNPVFEELFGYSREESRGRVLSGLIVPDEMLDEFTANIDLVKAGQNAAIETRRKDKHGSALDVSVIAIPISEYGYYGVYTDISKRKQTEKLIQTQMRELEAKNAEMERFTYTVSHDLRSPLITIKGFSGMLMTDIQKGNLQRAERDIQRIISAATRMEGLLEDLLTLSRVGRILNPLTLFSMTKLSMEVAELLNGVLKARGVRLSIDENMPDVWADKTRIGEVVQNLVENAVKFMGSQSEPRIDIGYYSQDHEYVFFVKDNGQGIESKYHEKIFGLFDKLKSETEGTGIGLALVKRIVEMHHGRVWVKSAGSGNGSSFFFSLPKIAKHN